jgi:TolB-like protein
VSGHGNPIAVVSTQAAVEKMIGEAGRFRAQYKKISWLHESIEKRTGCMSRKKEKSGFGMCLLYFFEGQMPVDFAVFPVVQTSSFEQPIVPSKTERLDQMQSNTCYGTQANNVAGICRNFWRNQDQPNRVQVFDTSRSRLLSCSTQGSKDHLMITRNSAIWLLVCFLASSVQAGPVARKRPASNKRAQDVAIWDLRTLGLAEDKARRVFYDLKQAFDRIQGFRLVAEPKIMKRLKRKRISVDAPLDKVVPALKVNWVLTGTLGGLGEEVSLDLRLLDGRTGKQVRKADASLPVSTSERRSVLDEILVQLLNPTQWVGAIELDVSVDGARVHLDGQPVASTPLKAPITGLIPGKHILRITKDGYGEFSKFVVVRHNQLARLKVDLNNSMVVGLLYERKRPTVPEKETTKEPDQRLISAAKKGSGLFQTVMAWTCLGVGAGLLGAGIYFGVATDRKVMTSVFSASGGVLLAGSLVLFLIGIGEDDPAQGESRGISFLPGVSPEGGLSIGLAGRF